MNLLVVETSPRGQASASREVARYLTERLRSETKQVVIRDLSREPLPHISNVWVEAAFTPIEQRSASHQAALRISDQVIDEVVAADVLVISTPMWNFGLPSVLKAWVDHLSRAGRTFTFVDGSPRGPLNPEKKVFFILSSGSRFSTGPFAPWDLAVPSMKTVLAFMGLTNVEIIRVEGTNQQIGRDSAVQLAKEQIDQLLNKQELSA